MTGDHTNSARSNTRGVGSRPPELYAPHDDDPRTIGVYRIAGRLGAGWSGVVYGALDLDGQCVAVKILRPEHAQDSAFQADFPHDVERLRRVGGVCTTPVLAADAHAQSPWVATRYAPGRTLNEHLRELGPLSGDSLLSFAAGLAEALAGVHAAGLAHRDVKPDNAILTTNGPALVDFGLATAGRPVGRAGWVFPEGYAGATPGPEADIFGWACVVTTAATGRPPFGSGTAKELRHRVLNSDPDLSGIPNELQFTLRWALAKDPEDRPHASTVLRTLLSEINDANPSTATAPDARLRALLARDWTGIAPRRHDPRQWALASEDLDAIDDLGPEETHDPATPTDDAATTGVNTTPTGSPTVGDPRSDATTAFTRSTPSTDAAGADVPASGVAAPSPTPTSEAAEAASPPVPADDGNVTGLFTTGAPESTSETAAPNWPATAGQNASPVIEDPDSDATAAFTRSTPSPTAAAAGNIDSAENDPADSPPPGGPPPPGAPASAAASAPATAVTGTGPTSPRRSRRAAVAVLATVLLLALVGGGYALYRVLPLGSLDGEGPVTADGGAEPETDDQAPASPGSDSGDASPESDTSPPNGDSSADGEDNAAPGDGAEGDGDPPWPPEMHNAAQQDGYAADLRLRSDLGPGCLFDEGAQLTREATTESSPPSDCLDLPLTSGDELRISGSRTFSGSNPGGISVEEFAIHTPDGVIRPDSTRSTQTVDGASVTYELVFPAAPSAGLLSYTGSPDGSGPYPAVGICYNTRTGFSEGLDTCS